MSPARRAALRRLGRRQALVAVGLGVWYTGNAGTYYAGLETVPASLAGVLVYLYPAIVAVLSIRYATRLSGRRPWIALGIALVGVVLALGGIDLADAAAGRRDRAGPRLAADLRRLDHPLGAAGRRALRAPRPRTPASGASTTRRPRRALMITATGRRVRRRRPSLTGRP